MIVAAAADLCRLAGPRLIHVTAAQNLPLIHETGLWPAAVLADRAGVARDSVLLRAGRMQVGAATLTHQRPILHALGAARAMLDGHSPESWAAQLDQRVFFWPERLGTRFAGAVAREAPVAILQIDAARLAALVAERIDLSPINSGNFRQGGARAQRGDWIYVPLSAGAEAFRTNRRDRGLTRARDSLREVCLRGGLGPDALRDVLVQD